MTLKCPADGCLSLHPHGHSLAMHLFKSEDEPHAEWDDLDDAQDEVYHRDDLALDEATLGDGRERSVEDGPEPSPDGVDAVDAEAPDANRDEPSPTPPMETVEDGPATAPEDAGDDLADAPVDTVEQDAPATDGGMVPPTPDQPAEPTIPDHFVPVEEFLQEIETELPDEATDSDEWREFREAITSGDEEYVDTQASDFESGEVETADV